MGIKFNIQGRMIDKHIFNCEMSKMTGKTVVITGASQGIGQAIALRFAHDRANVVVLTKDTPANINLTTEKVIEAGGQCLAQHVDVRDEAEIKEAVAKVLARFGGIDVLINNTSATGFTNTLKTSPEQFDLLLSTSVRAAFLLSRACFPSLQKAQNPHIINISPPLNMESHWFKDHLAFSIGKYAMSLCTLGLSSEFQQAGIAVNSLWPQTTIATQTIKDHFLPEVYSASRWPSIMGEAAHALSCGTMQDWTGQFFTDEALLRKTGVVDFSQYAVDPTVPLMQPLFIPIGEGMTPLSKKLFLSKQGQK